MKEHISLVIRKAVRMTNRINITLDGLSTKGVRHLVEMCHDGALILTNEDMVILMAILQNGWFTGCPRKFTVTLAENFNESWFVGHMFDALQDIEIST